jgi:hypothetical protein
MAKVRKNIIIRGLSGDLGKQLRIRTGPISGRTNVSAIPEFVTKRKDSPAQAGAEAGLPRGVRLWRGQQREPHLRRQAKGKERQAKNVAMADWFHPPQILEIDLRGWRGCPGDVIRVLAVDDVQVAGVRVEIADEAGTMLETGRPSWRYRNAGNIRSSRRTPAP